MKKVLYLAWLIIALFASTTFAEKATDTTVVEKSSPPSFHLKLVRVLELAKPSGNVDQLIPLPDGGFLTRDSTYNPLQSQVVEVYGPSGNLISNIGSYGQEPGQ